MISKEEIEEAKKRLQKKYDKAEDYKIEQVFLTYDFHAIGIFLRYIEQLETRDKKISEILDKYEHIEANEDSALSLYSDIKEIMKGENDE